MHDNVINNMNQDIAYDMNRKGIFLQTMMKGRSKDNLRKGKGTSTLRLAMLAVVTMIAALEAKAEDYVFMYNGHYLANNSGQISDVTTFDPATCIWNGTSGGTFTNQGYYNSYCL